jgi:FkbH-like protein
MNATVTSGNPRSLRLLCFGACSVQSLLDPLREEASSLGYALSASATGFDDVAAAAEAQPDAILVGHFRQKNDIFEFPAWPGGRAPIDAYVRTLQRFLQNLRAVSAAPVLVLNLPTPSVSPLGMADRGRDSHVNRVRALNLEVAGALEAVADAHVLDADAVLGTHGRLGRVDDQLVGFGHLGWLNGLVRQYREPLSGLEPYSADVASMPEWMASPAGPSAERIVAREALALVRVLLGHDRKKCVIVDLDHTLWPGVLADMGEPFFGRPAFDTYPLGLHWGLHSALKALAARGLLLACVSKNDERVVRELWRYHGVPHGFFLELTDFVTTRIDWNEKVDNIREIASELNLGLDAMVFIDDNPIERAKVSRYLPEVWVLGESPYALRTELLTDPRLQVPHVTAEAARRGEMTRSQIARERHKQESALDPEAFLRTLELGCRVERAHDDAALERIHELVQRTNQFNTSARRYSRSELRALIADGERGAVYTLGARDRFADYGLVGACVVEGDTIELVVCSCRVLGLGLEHVLLDAVIAEQAREHTSALHARYVPSDRNMPARNLFPEHGFSCAGAELWRLELAQHRPIAVPHAQVALAEH